MFPAHRRGLDGLTWLLQLNVSPSGPRGWAPTTSRARCSTPPSSTCSTRSAAGWRRTRSASRPRGARRWPSSAADDQATVIGLDRGPARPRTRRSRTPCSATGSTSTTRIRLGRHVSTVDVPGGARRGRAQGATGRERADGDRRRATRSSVGVGMAASSAVPRRAASTRPRSAAVFGATTAAAPARGLDAETTDARARDRRARWPPASSRTSPTARRPSRSTRRGQHTARTSRARLAAHGADGPHSIVEGKFGLYHAYLAAGEGDVDIEGQLADLGVRWETPRIAYKPYPACHFMHGSLGATADAVAGRTFAPEEIDEVVVTVPAAGVSLVLEPQEQKKSPRGRSTRGSSRCSTPSPRCSCAATSASPTTRTRRSPTRPCSTSRRRSATRRRSTRPTRRRSRAASASGSRTARRSRPTSRTRRAARRTRCRADEVREKFRGNASLALARRRRSTRSRRRSSRSRARTICGPALVAACRARGRRV